MHGELVTLPLSTETAPAVIAPASRSNTTPADYDDGLLGQALPIIGVAYGSMFLLAAAIFWSDGSAFFAVMVSVGYAMMYFGVPILMGQTRRTHDGRWTAQDHRSNAQFVDTFTGPLKRWEALLQMVLIPIAVSITFIAFCIIWVVQSA